MQHITHIAAAAMRLTANPLAFDANPHELRKAMRTAVIEPDGTSKNETPLIDQNVVDRVLMLLESRLTPSEILAVKQILTAKPKRQDGPARNPEEIGEDARNARLAFDDYARRFPSAARIKIEPSCAPAPQQHAASSASDYAKRFPSAMRIGQA